MNIIEAMKSGKKFKRPELYFWYSPVDDESMGKRGLSFSNADILADDWEIEEEKVWITRSQLTNVIAELAKEEGFQIMTPFGIKPIGEPGTMNLILDNYSKFMEKLGFK